MFLVKRSGDLLVGELNIIGAVGKVTVFSCRFTAGTP